MIIKLLEEYGHWGFFFSLLILTVIVMFSDRSSGVFQAWLGTNRVIKCLSVIIESVITSYRLFKSKESAKKIINLLKEYWHWGLVFSLFTLTVIVMLSDRASDAFQVWLGTDKKGVIGYLGTIIGAIALYGLFKSKESAKRIINSLKEYWHWGLVFFSFILTVIVMLSDRASDAFQVWLGTDKKGVIGYLGTIIGAIALYRLFKSKESTKKIIRLLKEYWHWELVFFLAILIAIAMFFDRSSDVFRVWLGTGKKEIIGYLYWAISSVMVLYGLFKFKENEKRYIKKLKEYGPWVFIVFFAALVVIVMFSAQYSDAFQTWLGAGKSETIQFFGWAIGGVIALYGFLKFEERAQAQNDANDLERFNAANEHLSEKNSEKENAMHRIASFYEFYYLARHNENYREIASDILAACLELMPKDNCSKEKQHLLNVLFGKGKNLWKLSAKDIDLQKVCLEKMNLAKFDLQDADLRSANLRGANLRSIDLRNADLRDADLRGADLRGADLWGADLRGADLWGADLHGADLQGADLQGVDLHGMDLQDINLQAADLQGAILTRAILIRGNLKGAVLESAQFDHAILRDANLSGSYVQDANFQNANLKGAIMLNMRSYLNANFQKAKYNADTKGPTKDVDLSILEMNEDER